MGARGAEATSSEQEADTHSDFSSLSCQHLPLVRFLRYRTEQGKDTEWVCTPHKKKALVHEQMETYIIKLIAALFVTAKQEKQVSINRRDK